MYKLVRNTAQQNETLKNPLDHTDKVFEDYQDAKLLAAKLNTYIKYNLHWKVKNYFEH